MNIDSGSTNQAVEGRRFASIVGIEEATLSERWLRAVRALIPLTVLLEIVQLRAGATEMFASSPVFLAAALPWLAIVLLSGTKRFGRLGSSLAFLSLLIGIIITFPSISNHSWLTLTVLAVLALLDGRSPSQRVNAALVARVQVAAVLFYSGLQKLAAGLWLDGTMLGHAPRFSESAPIVWIEQCLALLGVNSASETALSIASMGTWIGELLSGVGLLFAPTAAIALVFAIVMLVVIELAAHEFIFGSLMLILFSMSFRSRWLRGVSVLALVALTLQTISKLISA